MCMKKKVLQVRPLSRHAVSEAAQLGRALLSGKTEATVTYRRKQWPLRDLVQHLADRVQTLERHQCKPNVKCLFEGQQYLEEKYIDNYEPPIYPYDIV
jgi:hypothetical protein